MRFWPNFPRKRPTSQVDLYLKKQTAAADGLIWTVLMGEPMPFNIVFIFFFVHKFGSC